MTTKTADSKGRVALGKAFANSPVIIQWVSPTEARVVKAKVIPESEAWLWDNQEAFGMVKQGLHEAKQRKFTENPPDLDLAKNKTPGAYRVFWCYGPNTGEITIIAITPHP